MKLYSQNGLEDWKNLSKKGMANYELFHKLSGLKPKIKPTEAKDLRTQKDSRYNT